MAEELEAFVDVQSTMFLAQLASKNPSRESKEQSREKDHDVFLHGVAR